MLRAALVGVFLSVGANASAQNVTGNDLFDACESDGLPQAGYCIGYITGAIEGMRWGVAVPIFYSRQTDVAKVNETSNFFLQICEPEGIINRQYQDIVIEYLRRNPASRHEPARGLIQLALGEAFPCQ